MHLYGCIYEKNILNDEFIFKFFYNRISVALRTTIYFVWITASSADRVPPSEKSLNDNFRIFSAEVM